jgi:hypothetical protein
MRVIATTVVRESIRGKQKTGYIYDIDWDALAVRTRLAVPDPSYPESDDNPRGGVRGGRGVAVTKDGILVANYDTVYTYDDEWKCLDSYSHPLFIGTHEVDWDGQHLYMAATGIDVVLRYDPKTRQVETAWDPHGPELAERFKIRTRPHAVDGTVDYRVRQAPILDECHINGVTRSGDATIVNCGLVRRRPSTAVRSVRKLRRRLGIEQKRENRKHSGESWVVRVNGTATSDVLLQMANHDFPTHNGQLLPDRRIVVNDSTNNTVRVFTPDGQKELFQKQMPGTWLRGLEPVEGSRVLLGTAPATVVLLDVESGETLGSLKLSDNPNEAIHGLTVCPDPSDRR